MSDFTNLADRIRKWAKTRCDLRVVVIVGSQARAQPPADEYSDLDLVLFCANPDVYAVHAGWAESIGAPWLAVRGTTGRGDLEWAVVFEGGAKVDFVFTSLPEELRTAPLMALLQHSAYGFVYQRGARVLFDREHPEDENRILSFPGQAQSNPTYEEFCQAVQRFFLQGLRAARFLRRGELWRAARLINGGLKDPYLTLLEWHARSAQQPRSDTWYEGHFLEQWADPRALRELPGLFAACTPKDLWHALWASLEAMRWIAGETASQLGLVYPVDLDAQITQVIQSLREAGMTERNNP
jgi:aminoglycoside 6-adenylyltransferase